MKFGKNRLNKKYNKAAKHPQWKKDSLWRNPGIVEELFHDESWSAFQDDLSKPVPSTRMADRIAEQIDQQKLKKLRMQRKDKRVVQWLQGAVAAAILLIFGVGMYQSRMYSGKAVGPVESASVGVGQDEWLS